jgi:hypothetical protein
MLGRGRDAGIASAHARTRILLCSAVRSRRSAPGRRRRRDPALAGAELLRKPEGCERGGARALGLQSPSVALCERIRSGAISGLIVLGHDALANDYLGGIDALARLDTVIALDSHASDLQRVAHVLFPTRVAAEKHGTLTNHAGRVQRVEPAVEPAFDARSEGEVLAAIGHALGLPGFDGHFDAHEASKALAQSRARVRERLARRGRARWRAARERLVIVEVLIKSLFILLVVVAALAPVITWIERKQSAVMQDRIGANRADINGITVLGLLHPLADVIKLLSKEDVVPFGANRVMHLIAPLVAAAPAVIAYAVIPYGGVYTFGDYTISLVAANPDWGLLYIFAIGSIATYGTVMAGWSSNNNWSLLGGLRASAQMISVRSHDGALGRGHLHGVPDAEAPGHGARAGHHVPRASASCSTCSASACRSGSTGSGCRRGDSSTSRSASSCSSPRSWPRTSGRRSTCPRASRS